MLNVKADATSKGERLDAFLSKAFPEFSRARLQALIANGDVKNKNEPMLKSSYKIRGDEDFTLEVPAPKVSGLIAEDIDLDILYNDDDLVVINKAAGMVVHPGAGNWQGTLVNAMLHHFPGIHVGDTERPGIVHRLDKETSGVLVCAKNEIAHRVLSESFKSREVNKTYRAFCLGSFKRDQFELQTGHQRHKIDRKRFTTKLKAPTVEPENRTQVRLAHSRFQVVLSANGVSELQVELLTGRTHQIRAHLADIGHPLLKDALYGGVKPISLLKDSLVKEAAESLTRHALHAEKIGFNHPVSKQWMEFVAPLPADLLRVHEALS